MENFRKNSINVYFIGIGGIAMSGLAKYLLSLDFNVFGSDKNKTLQTIELENLGAKIFYKHDKNNLKDIDVVVYSSAISLDNEELKYATENNMCIYSRSSLLKLLSYNFLKRIGVAGCHGKTTATAMLSHIFYQNNSKFTTFIGGNDKKLGNFISFGKDYLITEICEYNKNINDFDADICAVLNIDNDHLNSYANFADLCETFFSFINKSKISIVNADDKILQKAKKDSITFGINNFSDYQAKNIVFNEKSTTFQVFIKGKYSFKAKINTIGIYNVYNALSAIAIAKTIGYDNRAIKRGLNSFVGVKRRNEHLKSIKKRKILTDYCHHPTEIKSFIDGLKTRSKSSVFVLFQPHTYSRTKILFDDFVKVFSKKKNIYIYKEYPARENYDFDGSSKKLATKLPNAKYYESFEEMFKAVLSASKPNDLILVLGAGDIYDKTCDFINNFNDKKTVT